jgi:ArsR family transcriptional regulator
VPTELTVIQSCCSITEPALTDEQASTLERVFKALADRHRVKILNRLVAADGEAVCVCEFTETFDLKQSTVSYHLKQLTDAGLISREKRGTYAYYRVVPSAFENVRSLLVVPSPGDVVSAA